MTDDSHLLLSNLFCRAPCAFQGFRGHSTLSQWIFAEEFSFSVLKKSWRVVGPQPHPATTKTCAKHNTTHYTPCIGKWSISYYRPYIIFRIILSMVKYTATYWYIRKRWSYTIEWVCVRYNYFTRRCKIPVL